MSKVFVIEAEKRAENGKSAAKSLRRANKIPAVVYGSGIEPSNISVDHKELTRRYLKGHFKTQICEINLDGDKIKTLPRVVSLHPVTDEITHIDFFKPNRKYKLKLLIPVHFINEEKCPAVKSGGVINHAAREVEVLCTIDNIPEVFELDLAKLTIGSSLHQEDIHLPEGVEFADKEGNTVIVSAAHQVEKEEEERDVSDVVVDSGKSDDEE